MAGDITRDGTKIILRSVENSEAWIWPRNDGQTVEQVLKNNEMRCSYTLKTVPQGEAVVFAPNGSSFYTTSEGEKQPIYLYHIISSAAGGLSSHFIWINLVVLTTLKMF